MRKISVLIVSLFVLISCADKYEKEFTELRDKIEEVNQMLDELCNQTNANMAALNVIVAAMETNDYITSIVPLVQNGQEIGYKITFFKGGVIAIYNGQDGTDGKPGQDGADGKPGQDGSQGSDGASLQIGVQKANDGYWYWTVNGKWMRDADGNKVRASAIDGKDGEDGKDGQNGEDGKDGASGDEGRPGQDGKDGDDGVDGKDGITPRMKIENGYWYVSLDNGKTWTEYGKATGEDGQPGPDAVTPEILISSVFYDQNNAYFTLASGEIITIPIKKAFALQLDQTTDILIAAGRTIDVNYSIIGVDDQTEIYCVCEGGWKAAVVKENFFSGHISVKAPYPFKDGKVLVMAQNAADDLVMQSLTFKELEMETSLMSYCDDPEQLQGWEEAICISDSTLVVGRAQSDGGYLIGITKWQGDEFALVSISPEGDIREVYSHEGVETFDSAQTKVATRALDGSQVAGGLGLFGNIVSMLESIGEFADGGGKLTVSGFILAKIDSINNMVKLMTGYDILAQNPYLAEALKYSGGLIDIAGALSGASGWGVVAIYANLIGTYIELYEEHIEAYYGNCSAQIENIDVDGSTAQIKVLVSGWENYYNTLEVGIAVSDYINPSMSESSQIRDVSHNGEYFFTHSGLKVGATYHCRPFIADKSRESLWKGWIGELAGPLVRYGNDKSFSVPRPAAYTGDVEEKTDKTATVACSFANVPSGASCGIEVDESRKISTSRDSKSVTISGLSPATTYRYRAYVTYQGTTYYGVSKTVSTDLPDVSGTWTCKEIHEKSDGTTTTVTYSVTLNKDGTVTLGKDEYYNGSSWGRTETTLSVSWSVNIGSGSNWSSTSTDLSIKFDDPKNPTSGKGAAYTTNANSTVGGFAPKFYANIEMSR